MSLAQLLGDPERLLARIRVKAPEPKMLARAGRAIPEREATERLTEDVAALQARLAELAAKTARLSARDLREGCHVFLLAPDPPAHRPDVGPWLLEQVRVRRRPGLMSVLIDAYLDGFDPDDPDDPGVQKLGAWLEAQRSTWPWRARDPWPDRAERFALFRPDEAPRRLADLALTAEHGPEQALTAAGLDSEARRRGGLAEAGFGAACVRVATMRGSTSIPSQLRVLDWAASANGTQAFPRAWPALVDAALTPWGAEEPPLDHKTRVIETLRGFAGGDPRTKPAPWRPVEGRPSMAVLMRWLTRASVMQFLDIVDESLREPSARLMWAYRRAFWTSYLLGDVSKGEPCIDVAWVAFGSNAAQLASRAAQGRADFSAFGQHNVKGTDQSALIVQIGDLTIVDWSHSGKYNVWRRVDRNKPEFFKSRYIGYGAHLDDAPFQDSHVGAAYFTWQKRLAAIIEDRPFTSEKSGWRPRRV